MVRSGWLCGVLALLHVGAARAQTVQDIDGAVPIFCTNSAGVFTRLPRTTYKDLQDGFERQFGWGHVLRTPSNSAGELEFSKGGTNPRRERIYYEVVPYNNGIALLRMHVRLQGKTANAVGKDMCGETIFVVNMPAPDTPAASESGPASVPPPAEPAVRSAGKAPDLSDYPATLYSGRAKMPDFNNRDRDYTSFRTRIRDGLNAGPNFAGHYALVRFGCGMGCSGAVIADVITGQVFNFPLGGEENPSLDLKFAATSNLVLGRWMASERCIREYLLWTGRGFKSLGTAGIGEEAACN